MTVTQDDLTQQGLLAAHRVVQVPQTFMPARNTVRIAEPLTVTSPYVLQTQPPTTTPSTSTAPATGTPENILSLAAVQSPVKVQAVTASNITVSFTHDPADKNYSYVDVWITGYHGSKNPVLVASGALAPINFVLDATGETVTVTGQAVSAAGNAVPLAQCLSTSVTLSGQVSAPPAPTISQFLIGTSTGFQFGFNQVSLPAGDQEVIAAYKVYRATSNSFGASSLLQTITPTPNLSGAITVTDTLMTVAGSNYFYWVTAVNTAGFESTATAASAIAITGSVGSLPWSVVGNMTYTSTTTSITWTWSGLTILRADGTSSAVPNGSQPVTGLSPSTTYYFYPFWDETVPQLVWISGGVGSPAYAQTATSATLAQTQNLRNRIPLSNGGMPAATPSSGSGGGSGGGGGGGGCFSDAVTVRTVDGFVRFDEIGPVVQIVNETGTFWADHIVHENYSGIVIDLGNEWLVTIDHPMKDGVLWVPALHYYSREFPVCRFEGRVHNLHVRSAHEADKHYVLETGDVAHNTKPI